jgi:uncharacterized protein
MRFKINQIGDDGLAVDVPITGEWLAAACPDLDARPAPDGLRLRGSLAKSGDDYLLRADLRGALETTCARCLEPARVLVSAPMVITFVAADDDDDAEPEEDSDVVTFSGNEIDVGDDVRDELLLAIPVSPHCTSACRGLCPVCGGNRNVVLCDCEERQKQALSPLAALGRFKD